EADFSIADATAEAPVADVTVEPDAMEQDIPEFEISGEMRTRFCQDSAEVLDEAEQTLIALETASGDERTPLVAAAFRHLHSFKGNCGFMQLGDLEKLSHKMENVLGSMRDGVIEPNDSNIGILLKTLDLLKGALAEVGGGGNGEIRSCKAMLQFIDEMVLGAQSKTDAPVVKPAVQTAAAATPPPTPPPAAPLKGEAVAPAPATLHDEIKRAAESRKPTAPKAEQPSAAKGGDPVMPDGADARPSTASATASSGGSIRVDVDKLDSLINLVGELIIAEAMVLRNPTLLAIEDEALERGIHQLRRVSTDLQDVAMSVRMIPLAATFRRMIRLVHDTAKKSGKQAVLSLVGEDTEVDKNVIEQIGDPLVHIIRNSVDHGIEPPEDRVKLGKKPEGTVIIEARHEGGEVWIIIRDDGRGLDRAKIQSKAMQRGLLKGVAEEHTDEEIFAMIFHPGFSTADKVTDISGRGVGMDVVKKNIEKLNGKVRVKSVAGQGTDIILQIPLTMAIIDGMLVRVGSGLYTLPLLVIRECIPHPAKARFTITPDGVESILVRGELIPVLRLHKIFKKAGAEKELSKGILVVVQTESEPVALLVDELVGQQETVIKGLSSYLGHARGISGCTVLGNGEVSLIIDVASLIAMREERADHEG
ncbi:MAG TPA: chemotaxis protein CheA, partial [Verrucomicrobia bacterium]|nr:chemotaxis protein CheA [Verrucomicrobiota bacterium]